MIARIALVLVACLVASGADAATTPSAAATTLDDLLEAVRSSSERQHAALKERERRFIAERDRRQALLRDARSRRQAAEAEADRLRAAFEAGEEELADLETALDAQSGDLRDVFAVVHEVAGDAVPMVQNSLVSSELGERVALAERLARKDVMPTAVDMRALWLLFLEEMNESGKTTRFETPVISAGGEEGNRTVTRIGTFNALSEGEYLRYLPETGRLLALARQPAGTQASDTLAFERSDAALMTIPLDPSRGSILSLVVQRPGLREQIEQGGVIGYLIIAIGIIGVALGAERLIRIYRAQRVQRRELADTDSAGTGPVNRIRSAARDADYRANPEALAAKMDEIVAVAAEELNRGLPTLAMFAAVSPLLGLLGTVTGMIETFQVITLFGAGDPRLMSGGISQALITTQLGLSVAIPLLLIHSFAQGRANALTATLDETAANLFASEQATVGADKHDG